MQGWRQQDADTHAGSDEKECGDSPIDSYREFLDGELARVRAALGPSQFDIATIEGTERSIADFAQWCERLTPASTAASGNERSR